VVELATLERWYTRKGIEGSNPSLSAEVKADSKESALLYCAITFRKHPSTPSQAANVLNM
jgi:hypothetical protein